MAKASETSLQAGCNGVKRRDRVRRDWGWMEGREEWRWAMEGSRVASMAEINNSRSQKCADADAAYHKLRATAQPTSTEHRLSPAMQAARTPDILPLV